MKKTPALLAIALVTALHGTPASAYARPGDTIRVTVRSDGTETSADSYHAVLSGNGRYIVFTSYDALLPEDTNGNHADIYRRDLVTGELTLVSVSSSGRVGENNSRWPSISADGRVVVFESEANDLVPSDTNGMIDAFARDLVAGTTKRVSVAADGTQSDFHARYPEVSGNGRYVSFISDSEILHPDDDNLYTDVFLHDLQTGAIHLISRGYQGAPNALHASWAEPNGDGSVVAWSARSPMSDPPDVNGIYEDVFVTDRVAGTTERISDSPFGVQGDSHSIYPSMSDDGSVVAYQSSASNLIPNDTNGAGDVFVFDRTRRRTERISVSSTGAQGDFVASRPFVSGDGRFVAFVSGAANLVAGDANGVSDVYVHDRLTRTTELVSRTPSGQTPDGLSLQASVSGDGRLAAFMSRATNVVPEDENGVQDIFVFRRGPAVGAGKISATRAGDGIQVEGWARFGGVVLAQGTDPAGDAVPAGHADLVAARVIHRPEEEDLLASVDLAPLPDATPEGVGLAGLPTISYLVTVTTGTGTYQVRVTPAPDATPTTPSFVLSRCAPTCTVIGPVPGSYGATGDGFVVSIPLTALGGATQISGMSVGTTQQVATSNRSADSLSLGPATLARPTVSVGSAAPGTPAEEVAFTEVPSVNDGRFSATVPGAAGPRDVWARACLGTTCGASTVTA